MNDSIVEQLHQIDFDTTSNTLIPVLDGMLDSAESWMGDDYHTTGVLTILTAFRSVCEKFDCDLSEHPQLKLKYDDLCQRLLRWFEHRDSKGDAKTALCWQKLAALTRLFMDET